MRYLLLAIGLMTASLSAETIGSVEYQLPKQEWKIAKELKGSEKVVSRTVFYVPEQDSMEKTDESFVVHANNLAAKPITQASIEKVLQSQFPDHQIGVTILEQTPDSILYEWSVNFEGKEKVHGWTRAFYKDQETVLLSYQTEQAGKVDQARPIWLKTLKEAKWSEASSDK